MGRPAAVCTQVYFLEMNDGVYTSDYIYSGELGLQVSGARGTLENQHNRLHAHTGAVVGRFQFDMWRRERCRVEGV